MKLIKTGKTKDVYKDIDGNYVLIFKDSVTGFSSGQSDPGGNLVVGSVDGVAYGALKMSAYYFELLAKQGIQTHYISSDLSKNEMKVCPVKLFGSGDFTSGGLEFVLRYKASGSFVRRFSLYCREGQKLPKVFEVTLKDDSSDDPPVTQEILAALGLMSPVQYDIVRNKTILICDIIRDDLASRGLELIDIKLEFGLLDGVITLVDEISPGNMRVYKESEKLDYLSLSSLF